MRIALQGPDESGMLDAFAKNVGSIIDNGRVIIPGKSGNGYIHGFRFGAVMRMMIKNYQLNEDVIVTRARHASPTNMLMFNFQNIIRETGNKRSLSITEVPSVQIATLGIDTEMIIPGNTRHRSISIALDADYLKGLIEPTLKSTILKTILENRQPLFFDQLIFASVQKVADEIVEADVSPGFQQFFHRLKAEELICRLLIELVKREEAPMYALNISDIKSIYRIKDSVLKSLEKFPSIAKLSLEAGMSESKLKRLFKQVFGKSIFNYYQSFRMEEAARLLREEKLSVSDVGYKLGFNNLSHFSKSFEEYNGLKPKKYSMLTQPA
jgi:AraC-like DNA-binding protein